MTPPPSKRRRTDINAVTEEGIAKLPSLEPDVLLAVFTHSSLGRHGPTEEYSDNSRLAELGRIALDAAVSTILYQKRPLMSLEDMAVSFLHFKTP
jgi:dsRNA-specific ribonuclease